MASTILNTENAHSNASNASQCFPCIWPNSAALGPGDRLTKLSETARSRMPTGVLAQPSDWHPVWENARPLFPSIPKPTTFSVHITLPFRLTSENKSIFKVYTGFCLKGFGSWTQGASDTTNLGLNQSEFGIPEVDSFNATKQVRWNNEKGPGGLGGFSYFGTTFCLAK